MMTDGVPPFSEPAMFQKVMVGFGTMAIVSVGAWTANTLSDLTTEVHALRLAMTSLAARVDSLPPKDLVLRVQILEKHQEKMEDRLRAIASRVPKRLGIEVDNLE